MKVEEMYSGAQKRRLAPLKFPIYSGQRPSCLSERGCTAPFTAPRHTGTQSQGTSQHHPILRVGWGCCAPRMWGHGGRKKRAPSQRGSEGEDAVGSVSCPSVQDSLLLIQAAPSAGAPDFKSPSGNSRARPVVRTWCFHEVVPGRRELRPHKPCGVAKKEFVIKKYKRPHPTTANM